MIVVRQKQSDTRNVDTDSRAFNHNLYQVAESIRDVTVVLFAAVDSN